MTRRISKKARRQQVIAWALLITVVVALIAMISMALYTLVISFEAENYTREILQAEQDAKSYPEGKQQEYKDSIYVEANANRQALYNSNAYTQWFFNDINGFTRLVVLAILILVPTAIIYKSYKAFKA